MNRLRPGLVAGDPDAHEQVAAEFDQAMAGAAEDDRRQVGQYLDWRLDEERSAAANQRRRHEAEETAAQRPLDLQRNLKPSLRP